MVSSRRPLLVAVIAAVTASALLVSVSAAEAAKGGNSANAKLCQKGGWQDLVGSEGQSFASEEECVSHAAQGGTLREPTPLERWRAICEGAGGAFGTSPAGTQWQCNGQFDQATYDALDETCTEAGGFTSFQQDRGTYFNINCNFF